MITGYDTQGLVVAVYIYVYSGFLSVRLLLADSGSIEGLSFSLSHPVAVVWCPFLDRHPQSHIPRKATRASEKLSVLGLQPR